MNDITNVLLPPGLEKEAQLMRWGRTLLNPLIGVSKKNMSPELSQYVGKYVRPSGMSHMQHATAMKSNIQRTGTAAAREANEAALIPAGTGKGGVLNSNWSPVKWVTGGEQGLGTLGARAVQGGIFGKGGIIRSELAANPMLGKNFEKVREAGGGSAVKGFFTGKGLGPSIRPEMDAWYKPWSKIDPGARLGLVGRGAVQTGKVGLFAGFPALGLYGALNPEEGDPRGLGQRLGGWVGETTGSFASWPLGFMSWAPSMAAGMLPSSQEEGSVLNMISKANPWELGRMAGEQIGSGFNVKDPDAGIHRKWERASKLSPEQRRLRNMQLQARINQQQLQAQLPPDLAYRQRLHMMMQDPRTAAYMRDMAILSSRIRPY